MNSNVKLKATIKYTTWDYTTSGLAASSTKLLGGTITTGSGAQSLPTVADQTFTYKFSETENKGMCDAGNAQKINVKEDGIEYITNHNVNFE